MLGQVLSRTPADVGERPGSSGSFVKINANSAIIEANTLANERNALDFEANALAIDLNADQEHAASPLISALPAASTHI